MTTKRDLSFIDNIRELSAMPKISTDLMAMFQDSSRSWKDIAEKIKLDPALALFILKTSNSPFYGIKHEIRSIETAIKMLGLPEIRTILMSYFLRNLYTGPGANEFMSKLWEHSISVAVFSNILASSLNQKSEGVYLAGLLHDIGKLVINLHAPNEYKEVIRKADETSTELPILEEESFGFTHIDSGLYLLDKWNLSQFIKNAVLFHHYFISYRGDDPIVGLVAFANQIVHKYIDGRNVDLVFYLKHFRILPDKLDAFAEKTARIAAEYHSMMGIIMPVKKKTMEEKSSLPNKDIKKEKSFLNISATETPQPVTKSETPPSPPPQPLPSESRRDLTEHISRDTPYEGTKLFLQLEKLKKEMNVLESIYAHIENIPAKMLTNHKKMLELFNDSVDTLVTDPTMTVKLMIKKTAAARSTTKDKVKKDVMVFSTAADEVAYIMDEDEIDRKKDGNLLKL
jgi:putative nucleotidyltransferase with HDIG domain